MANYNRNGWLDTAMDQVRSRPEHKAIRAELLGHIEDKEHYFLGKGMEPQEAGKAAVAAMGDPVEVGKELDKAHPVWWAKLYTAAKAVILILCIMMLFCIVDHLTGSGSLYALWQKHPLKIEQADPYERGGKNAVVLDGEWAPIWVDGYKVEVVQAYWSTELYGGEQNVLEVDVKVSNPRPWAVSPLFVRRMGDATDRQIFLAVATSQGNRVYAGQVVDIATQTDGDVWYEIIMDFWYDDLKDYRYWGSWYFTFSVYGVELGDTVTLYHPDRKELTLTFEAEVSE